MISQGTKGLALTLELAYLATLAILAATASKDAFSNDEVRGIEKFAGDVMGCSNIPGLALGVVRGDATFSTGLGVANMVTGHPVDKRTLFNLGSTSKALVPYILAEIMNGKENKDGRIHWNSTLKEILRHDFDIEVPLPWAETTLKDMLIYKSGSSAADITTMVGLPKEVTREELIRRLRFLPATKDFLNSNHYSNIKYTIAGHLAERMSGMSWMELVKVKVLDKQHMNTSAFAPEGMAVEDAALPYRFHSKPGDPFVEQNISLFNLQPFIPIGSLMASAEEVTKMLRHLLHNLHDKGNDSGFNMLIRDAFHQWITVPSDYREGSLTHDSEVALGYGMGWYASTYRGQRRFKFSGSLYAYSSQIWLFPETLSAIFVSLNGPGNERAHRALEGIMYYTADTILRKSPWVDNNMTCCCRETDYDYDDHKDSPVPGELKLIKYLAPVEKYIGSYGHGLVGDLTIEPNQAGILILKLGRNLVGELTPDVTESKLKFSVTSPLMNTEEWCHEKTLEFLVSTPQAGDATDSKLYDKVRVYMKDHLFYEFHRGKFFESLLTLAEENDRRLREETEASNGTVHRGEPLQHENAIHETEYSYEDSDPVKDEADKNESNHSINNLHHDDDKSGFQETDSKSSSNLGLDAVRKVNLEGLQGHKSFGSEDQGDDPDLEETKDVNKVAGAGREGSDKNKSALKADNGSSQLQTFSIITFLLTCFKLMFNF